MALLIVVAGLEAQLRGKAATRWIEYGLLVGVLLLGACFGVAVDQVSSRISPAYFLYAKGVDMNAFAWGVVDLGARAGVTAGAVVGSVLLVVQRMPLAGKRGHIWHLFGCLWWPVGFALAGGFAGAMLFRWGMPNTVLGGYVVVLEHGEISGFRTVAGLHYGLYLGGVLGLVKAGRQVVFRRSKEFE